MEPVQPTVKGGSIAATVVSGLEAALVAYAAGHGGALEAFVSSGLGVVLLGLVGAVVAGAATFATAWLSHHAPAALVEDVREAVSGPAAPAAPVSPAPAPAKADAPADGPVDVDPALAAPAAAK